MWYNKIDETVRGKSKYCSDKCKTINRHNKLSELAKKNNFGGYNEKQFCMKTKSIRGWYKNMFCGSSWELAFVIYCLDHSLPIQRCTKCLTYTDDEGVIRKYFPDFEIDGIIYEIKGYKDKFALIKEQCFPEIIVIDRPKIQKYIFYATDKYGKDYIKLLTNKRDSSSAG